MALKRRRKKVTLALVAVAIVVAIILITAIATAATKRRRRRHKTSSPFASSTSFGRNYDITWAPDHVRLSNQDEQLDLLLNQGSGAGFGSRNRYLFGDLGMQIRLVQSDASGTVVAYYISSLTDDRDEFTFQFFGNSSGKPYTLQTNVFMEGAGGREQRFFLWFDPTLDFHSYSIVWNQYQVIFIVDTTPIRVFKKTSTKPMGIYTSIWAAGLAGAAPVNWQQAPFVVSYLTSSLGSVDGCQYSEESPELCLQSSNNNRWWSSLRWNSELQQNLTLVRSNYLLYDYCNDRNKYPTIPIECSS